jgi:Dyp-type peroxidase family
MSAVTAGAATPAHPSAHDLRQIQGNLVGFNKDHQRFIFLRFADQGSARAFLAEIEPDLASAAEVRRFNLLFKEIHERRHGASDIVQAAWTNLALSFAGLELLGATGLEGMPAEFSAGMRERAQVIGDVEDSAPGSWIAPFGETIHALVILAADHADDLELITTRLRARIAAHNAAELLPPVDGNVRPVPFRGHEHFGFKDGISQPQITGVSASEGPQGDSVATGEFIVGYLNEDGDAGGQPKPPAAPDQPGYNPVAPPPPAQPLPAWAKNGSFLVFRRLRQNVQGFNDFVTQQAPALGLAPERLSAKLVGRWKSGAPLERVPGEAPGFDPSLTDPASDPAAHFNERETNRFDYTQDPAGEHVPRAAHIRKTNPRAQDPPGRAESNRHRILRRGIPYGPEFQPGEPPYPGGPAVPDEQDRGLVFLCYQSSIARGFEFVQSQWANKTDFPAAGDGEDPIISQDEAQRPFTLPPQGPIAGGIARWVQTTGGEYFFSPSLEAIRALAAPNGPPAQSA